MRTGERRPKWEWIFGILTVVALVSSSRVGHGLPMLVQDAAFLFLIAVPVFLIAMSWVGLARAQRNEGTSRWKVWISLSGCMALCAALAIPTAVLLSAMFVRLGLDWLRLANWCFGLSMVALLAGIFGARSTRFPLIVGGVILVGLIVIVPIGIL